MPVVLRSDLDALAEPRHGPERGQVDQWRLVADILLVRSRHREGTDVLLELLRIFLGVSRADHLGREQVDALLHSRSAGAGDRDHEGDIAALLENAGHHVARLADPPQADVLRVDVGALLEHLDRIKDDLGSLLRQAAAVDLTGRLAGTRFVPGKRCVTGSEHAPHDRRIRHARGAVVRAVAVHEHDHGVGAAPLRQLQITHHPERPGAKGDLLGGTLRPATRPDEQ